MMNPNCNTNQRSTDDRRGVLPQQQASALEEYIRNRAERMGMPTNWVAPRHLFADESVDSSSVASFADSTDGHPLSQFHRPTDPPSPRPLGNSGTPAIPGWQAPRHFYDNSVDGSTASFAADHPISQFHRPLRPPDNLNPAIPSWQAPRHFYDNSVDGSSVASSATDRHPISQFYAVPPSRGPPPSSNNAPWQAPRHFFDDDSDSESAISELPELHRFDPQDTGTRHRPPATSASASFSVTSGLGGAQMVQSNTDSGFHSDFFRGDSAFSEGDGGGINTTRDEDQDDLVPCFGNAVVLKEEGDYNPLDPRNNRPFLTTVEANQAPFGGNAAQATTSRESTESGQTKGQITVVPRLANIDFRCVDVKGKKPMTDYDSFARMYPLRGAMPREPETGKAFYWKTLACQYRCYPWAEDIYQLYQGPSQNCDVKKEEEARGVIMPVEHYHNATHDYARCWIFNTEFHQKMMIVPYWCFPQSLPKLGTLYNTTIRMVKARLGGRFRLTMRIKHGAEVAEAAHQSGHFLGVRTEVVESPGCWAKILSIHCRLIQNHNLNMIAREFQEVIYDKSQIQDFPAGANYVEGNGFIQPLPGFRGTMPVFGKDQPCFYLIKEFRQSAVEWDHPRTQPLTQEELEEMMRQERKEKEKTRYEWQPRSRTSVSHVKKMKTLGDKPRLKLSSAGNMSKTERVLLTIEILREIKERGSEFGPLCTESIYDLECLVGDREVPSKSKRLRSLTEILLKMIDTEGPYNWLKDREPQNLKDLFEIIKLNVNYLPKARQSVITWLRHLIFPENEESDYEEWD